VLRDCRRARVSLRRAVHGTGLGLPVRVRRAPCAWGMWRAHAGD
jgi:hypothetical protein